MENQVLTRLWIAAECRSVWIRVPQEISKVPLNAAGRFRKASRDSQGNVSTSTNAPSFLANRYRDESSEARSRRGFIKGTQFAKPSGNTVATFSMRSQFFGCPSDIGGVDAGGVSAVEGP